MSTLVNIVLGFGLGLAFSIPIGPVGVMCARRSLLYGISAGAVAGIGAALADATYAAVASAATAATVGFINEHRHIIRPVGGVFLILFGAFLLKRKPPDEVQKEAGNTFGAMVMTFLLVASNPLTILAFAAAFTILPEVLSDRQHGWLSFGVFCGGLTWWLTLSTLVHYLPKRFQRPTLINRVAAWLIIALGALGLVPGLD